MAVALRGIGAITQFFVPALPAGLTEDDIMILHIVGEAEDALADGQGDWGGTLIGTVESDSTYGANDKSRLTLYWKLAGASETAPTIDDPGNSCHQCFISAWSGCDTTSPLSGTPQETAGLDTNSPMTATGVTTADDGAMVIVTFGTGNDITFDTPVNANLESITLGTQGSSISGSDSAIAMCYGIKASAAATGNTTIGIGAANEEESHWTIALKPAGAASSIIPQGTNRGILRGVMRGVG